MTYLSSLPSKSKVDIEIKTRADFAMPCRDILNTYKKHHAVRKFEAAGASGAKKVRGKGKWKTWTASSMLRASWLVQSQSQESETIVRDCAVRFAVGNVLF